MPVIIPFRGLRFDRNRISFIGRVVAPPYDVIDPDQEQQLEERDRHNVVRLTLGKTPGEARDPAHYARAAETLRQWRDDGVLTLEQEPAAYIVRQTFRLNGQHFRRYGFIAGVLLEQLGKGSIHPHERTTKASKSDRYQLMEASHANLSQVIAIYSDPGGAIDKLVAGMGRGEPLYCFRDDDDVGYMVWAATHADAVRELAERMREQALVIADGHHRYESAFTYCRRHRSDDSPLGAAPEDYISALCVSVASPGLKSLPTHRRARANKPLRHEELMASLEANFEAQRVPVHDARSLQSDFDAARRGQACIGCLLPDQQLYLLTPRDLAALRPRFPQSAGAMSEILRHWLDGRGLPDALAIEPGSAEESEKVEYRPDASEIYWGVESGEFDVGFLLPPTPPQIVQSVACQSERLPMKSTYFFPKIASGLVMYSHEDGPPAAPG